MIEPLLAWYNAHLDGEWEHHFGFDIQTADNPGLIVTLRPEHNLGPDRVLETRLDPGGEMTFDIRIRDGALTGFSAPGGEGALITHIAALIEDLAPEG